MSQETETGAEDPNKQSDEVPLEAELVVEEVESEGDKAQRELIDANEQVLRVQAEMQNVRRRTQRDVENAHKFALDKFVAALLPVVDNLERALSTIDIDDDAQRPVAEGLHLTLKSFVDALTNFKVEQVDPAGQPFDADLHQAVSMLPSVDLEPNTVIDVFQKGYTLHGRLVRPAMVTVSKAP
ncbi:MAG: nucleotide exchange factor GrpE [Porticoccaceae bacterium]|nr:nucleotide exchange factor GrpE [Porticoccaceae bacterium]